MTPASGGIVNDRPWQAGGADVCIVAPPLIVTTTVWPAPIVSGVARRWADGVPATAPRYATVDVAAEHAATALPARDPVANDSDGGRRTPVMSTDRGPGFVIANATSPIPPG